jgi:hypothetical protein
MPANSIASFISLQYELAYPEGASEAEKLKLKALKCISDLSGLGRVVQHVTSVNVIAGEDNRLEDRGEAFDAGMFVLGQVIAGVADEGYDAIEKYSELVKEPEAD